jgi:PAS domain-containing protein
VVHAERAMVDPEEARNPVERPIPSLLSAMLRASEGILELLPIATFICDSKGTILQHNRHAVAVWGAAPKPGQTHDEFRESIRFFEWMERRSRVRWLPKCSRQESQCAT